MVIDKVIRELESENSAYRARLATAENEAVSLRSEVEAGRIAERALRRMLAFAYSGDALYGDDGELQDSRFPFPIDYVRDTVEQIEAAIHNRGMKAIADAGGFAAITASRGEGK